MGLQWYPPPRNEAGRQMGKDKTEEQIERSERDRLAAEAVHGAPWWRRIFGCSAR